MWLDHLPASVAFCDVETTGLGKHDRIVSFGGIGMISRNLMKGSGDLKYVYLVFDPGVGNRGGAARILASMLRWPLWPGGWFFNGPERRGISSGVSTSEYCGCTNITHSSKSAWLAARGVAWVCDP